MLLAYVKSDWGMGRRWWGLEALWALPTSLTVWECVIRAASGIHGLKDGRVSVFTMATDVNRCLAGQRKETLAVFAESCDVNTFTMTKVDPPAWRHWTRSWERISTAVSWASLSQLWYVVGSGSRSLLNSHLAVRPGVECSGSSCVMCAITEAGRDSETRRVCPFFSCA